ncbi:MAG: hypothetical protein JWN48_2977 [Myxococcaceae bacterium]|nr:hypothetical protein [Myxococcaceae bacterium]
MTVWRALGVGCGMLGWVSAVAAEPLACREDDRLSETAASLLLSGEPIQGSALLSRARAHGFDGVSLHARESSAEANLRSWLSTLRANGEGTVVCGEASTESRRLVLATLRGGTLSQHASALRGTLEPGFRAPSLVVETGEGELKSLPVTEEQLAAGFTLPAELAARRVQLIAESASGPRPVAELSLRGRAESASPASAEGDDSGPRLRSTEALLGQLGSFRRAQGVGTLRDNRLLSESAQRHAGRLCELGKLAHRVEGEDPEHRLKREHVSARGVGEVLARAESSDRAFRALLDSPSHRMALSRRDFTDAGVGQASDAKGQVCLVVLLASWPRRTP